MNEAFRNLTDHYDIANVYENPTWGSTDQMIVGKTDAQIGVAHERLVSIDKNHVEMCRFEDEDRRYFDVLCSEIEKASDISRASTTAHNGSATPSHGKTTTPANLRSDRMPHHTSASTDIFTGNHAKVVGEVRTRRIGDDQWEIEEEILRATRRYRPAAGTAPLSARDVANCSSGLQGFVGSAGNDGNTYPTPTLMLEGAEQEKAGAFESLFGGRKTRDHASYISSTR